MFRVLRVVVAGLALLSLCASLEASDGARVTGSLQIDGKTIPIKEILVEPFGSDAVSVLVSDAELPPPCSPLDAMAVVETHPLTGVMFTVTNDLELSPSGNALYNPALDRMDGYGVIRKGLTLKRSGRMARGTLNDTLEVKGHQIAIDLDLSIPMQQNEAPLTPRQIEGADSEPARALVKFVDAVIDGDTDQVMSGATSEMRKQLESAGGAADILPQLADFMLPLKMTITGTKVEGDHATLTAKGETPACMKTETSDGRIELQREDGAWKIAKISWES